MPAYSVTCEMSNLKPAMGKGSAGMLENCVSHRHIWRCESIRSRQTVSSKLARRALFFNAFGRP